MGEWKLWIKEKKIFSKARNIFIGLGILFLLKSFNSASDIQTRKAQAIILIFIGAIAIGSYWLAKKYE